MGDAPLSDAELEQLRAAPRRGRWMARCPSCRSSALRGIPSGCLECAACGEVLRPPPRGAGSSWEEELRLGETWGDYSAPGNLVVEWGRSTDREDGRGPGEEEELPPTVRLEAVRGWRDDELDAAITEHTQETQVLVAALPAMRRYLEGLEDEARTPPPRSERRRRRPDYRALLLEHTAEVEEDGPPAEDGLPAWFEGLHAALVVALRSQVQALALLAVNALRRRGVEVFGSLDVVSPRVRRAEPFGGLKHALRGAFGMSEREGGSSIPFMALPSHPLPQGVQFGRMAVKPSRATSARPREPSLEGEDVMGAIRAARIGERTHYEAGKVVKEPGRPLTEAEIELVRLVDVGRLVGTARVERTRRGRVVYEALEQLHPRDALREVQDLEGAPRTEREARLVLTAARKAIALVLEKRELIPVRAAAPPAPPRRPSSDPFEGLGSDPRST